MKLLFAIPHLCKRRPTSDSKYGSQTTGPMVRGSALRQCILALHQLFGPSQAMIHIGQRRTFSANQEVKHEVKVLIVTTEGAHALAESRLSEDLYEEIQTDSPPTELGFHCHRELGKRIDEYDYFSYLEDDLILRDPWWFEKLSWFNQHVDNINLLMANRYEVAADMAYKKCYVDGDLAKHVTAPFQDVQQEPVLHSKVWGRSLKFVRTLNPHAGCFFLNQQQARRWMEQPGFGEWSQEFIGPLESAATLSVMRAFRIYKPAPVIASFFEIEHQGSAFVSKVRHPNHSSS